MLVTIIQQVVDKLTMIQYQLANVNVCSCLSDIILVWTLDSTLPFKVRHTVNNTAVVLSAVTVTTEQPLDVVFYLLVYIIL